MRCLATLFTRKCSAPSPSSSLAETCQTRQRVRRGLFERQRWPLPIGARRDAMAMAIAIPKHLRTYALTHVD
jgi:hypothetical protein